MSIQATGRLGVKLFLSVVLAGAQVSVSGHPETVWNRP
jgi:hypothetical protein